MKTDMPPSFKEGHISQIPSFQILQNFYVMLGTGNDILIRFLINGLTK